MTETTKNLIKRAIRSCFPDATDDSVRLDSDGGCFRDWSYSKWEEDITQDEQEAEWAACEKFAGEVPGYEVERSDKNYFDINEIGGGRDPRMS